MFGNNNSIKLLENYKKVFYHLILSVDEYVFNVIYVPTIKLDHTIGNKIIMHSLNENVGVH